MKPTILSKFLLVLTCTAAVCLAGLPDLEASSFIGWQGANYDPKKAYGMSEPVEVSKQPLAYIWKDFLSKDEAKHIAQLALPHLRHSLVGNDEKEASIRTSYGMFIPRFQDATIAAISHRVAKWTGLPLINQENMQVLRYSPGQVYKPHWDSHGRMATVILYLSDTTAGGETAFPYTTDEHWTHDWLKPDDLSPECADGHISIKPEIGTAFLFYSMPPGAESNETLRVQDDWSLHTGCPPLEDQVKWTATVWVRAEPFRPEEFSMEYPKPPMPDSGACQDLSDNCQFWAEQGHCETSKPFMLGDTGNPPNCARACGACIACDGEDRQCVVGNRERLGYLGVLDGEVDALYPDSK